MMVQPAPDNHMDASHVYRFCPQSMGAGDTHGGAGLLLAERVAAASPGSAVRHIDLVILSPGANIAAHTHHTDNEELYIIVKGCGLMCLDEKQVPVDVGDVIRNRPGGRHGFANGSSENVWLVVVEFAFDQTAIKRLADHHAA